MDRKLIRFLCSILFAVIPMGQMCCCVKVSHSHVGIKEQWGKFDEVLEPGINLCTGMALKRVISLRLQQLDVKCQSKTMVLTYLVLIEFIIICKKSHGLNLLL